MNLIKIAKQIFDQQLKTKRQRAEQFIEKNLLQDEITIQDVYEIAAFAIQQLNNEDDLIINLTEKQLPKKIINTINKIKQFTNDHLQHVIVYTNDETPAKFIIDFLIANGQNGGAGNHQMAKATNQINNLIQFIDKMQYDEKDDLYLSIRSYDGDLLDNIYYWIIQFWI